MSPATLLRLGRVSNLPTVCSNVLTGALLSGAQPSASALSVLTLAMLLFYEAGMFLNDAFDVRWDAQHRPERPIPSGAIPARRVFFIGFSLLALAVLLVAAFSLRAPEQRAGLIWALLLAGSIVLYDYRHKNNPWGPLLMGACRVLVYLTVCFSLGGSLTVQTALSVVGLLGYLVGLSYVARQESLRALTQLWPLPLLALPLLMAVPTRASLAVLCYVLLAGWLVYCLRLMFAPRGRDIPGSVGKLIAGIALVDALFVSAQRPAWGVLCLACFALTLLLQRRIAGT